MNERIVLSIDGNVNAGKTTLLKSLAQRQGDFYVPEHSDLLNSVEWNEYTNVNSQDIYLETEVIKKKIIGNSSCRFFFMDRSFLSILAHTLSTTAKEKLERTYVVDRLCELISSKQIIIPNCFVFLKVDFILCAERYSENHIKKGTPKELVTPFYFNSLNSIYSKWMEMIDGYIITSPDKFLLTSYKITSYEPQLIMNLIKKISQENE